MPVLDMPNGLIERILEAAPELALPRNALDQTVSWSAHGALSLGDYIGVNAPHVAHKLALDSRIDAPNTSVVSADQLSDEDLKRVVYARLNEGADADTTLAVLGQGTYSIDELKQQIADETEFGQRLLAAERRNIVLLERLVESGKIRAEATESPIDVPDFEF